MVVVDCDMRRGGVRGGGGGDGGRRRSKRDQSAPCFALAIGKEEKGRGVVLKPRHGNRKGIIIQDTKVGERQNEKSVREREREREREEQEKERARGREIRGARADNNKKKYVMS